MYLCAPMRGPARQVDRVVAFADYHAVRSRPAVARLGSFHGDADLGDPDAVAFLHPVDDFREQWSGLIAQLLFGRCDAAKLVAVTRHFVLQNEGNVALLRRGLFSVKNSPSRT